MSASEPVKLWRYSLTNDPQDRQGWAIFHLDSKGFFAACSDFGDYVYHWRDWGRYDFREFVARELSTDPHYLGEKLAREKWHEFDKEKTVERVREEIAQAQADGRVRADDVADELEKLEYLESGQWEFSQWVGEQGLGLACCDAADLARTSPNFSLHAFCTRTMPRLAAVLLQELATERAQ